MLHSPLSHSPAVLSSIRYAVWHTYLGQGRNDASAMASNTLSRACILVFFFPPSLSVPRFHDRDVNAIPLRSDCFHSFLSPVDAARNDIIMYAPLLRKTLLDRDELWLQEILTGPGDW